MRELRTPALLMELTEAHHDIARRLEHTRPAIAAAITCDMDSVNLALAVEEHEERRKDREFWRPLKLEIEQFRRERSSGRQT